MLPSRFPNLLVNGSTGIAVGMATNIPPHNLGEVIDGIVALIDNPDVTLEELMELHPGPDFPTGGIIMGRSGIRAAYGTGRGKITLRGRDRDRGAWTNGRCQHHRHRDPLSGEQGPADRNDRRPGEGKADRGHLRHRRRVRPRRHADRHRAEKGRQRPGRPQPALLSYTQLQDTVGVIMLALVDGEPKVMNLKEMLDHYIEFQEAGHPPAHPVRPEKGPGPGPHFGGPASWAVRQRGRGHLHHPPLQGGQPEAKVGHDGPVRVHRSSGRRHL